MNASHFMPRLMSCHDESASPVLHFFHFCAGLIDEVISPLRYASAFHLLHASCATLLLRRARHRCAHLALALQPPPFQYELQA